MKLVIRLTLALLLCTGTATAHPDCTLLANGDPIYLENEEMADPRGRIKSKNGVTFTIESEDGNEYLAPVIPGYKVGDLVTHTEPTSGTVQITGPAQINAQHSGLPSNTGGPRLLKLT